MIMKDVMDLDAGMVLAQDILNSYDVVILAAGTKLSEEHIMNLTFMNLDFVFVESPDEVIEPPQVKPSEYNYSNPAQSKKVIQQDKRRLEIFEAAVEYYKEMYSNVKMGGSISSDEVFAVVKELVQEFYKYDDIFSVLSRLKSSEDYEYTHTTSMAIISVLLAKWRKLSHQDVYTIAQAAYLADIGKASISTQILKKADMLTSDERQLIETHVVLTQELLERSGGFSQSVIHIAATHHERLNGTGYPYGLDRENINQLTRIVSIADTYHALLSNRPYRDAYSIIEATEMLWNLSYSELDACVTERLVKFITSFLVGGEVVLSNGKTGKIIMANQYDKFRPLIKVQDEFIDLAKDRSCKIIDIVRAV